MHGTILYAADDDYSRPSTRTCTAVGCCGAVWCPPAAVPARLWYYYGVAGYGSWIRGFAKPIRQHKSMFMRYLC
jgi:hypothetical protein